MEEQGIKEAVAQLSDEELFLLREWHRSLMIRFDNVAFQYSQGLMPQAYFETIMDGVVDFVPIWHELGVRIPDTSRQLFQEAVQRAD